MRKIEAEACAPDLWPLKSFQVLHRPAAPMASPYIEYPLISCPPIRFIIMKYESIGKLALYLSIVLGNDTLGSLSVSSNRMNKRNWMGVCCWWWDEGRRVYDLLFWTSELKEWLSMLLSSASFITYLFFQFYHSSAQGILIMLHLSLSTLITLEIPRIGKGNSLQLIFGKNKIGRVQFVCSEPGTKSWAEESLQLCFCALCG